MTGLPRLRQVALVTHDSAVVEKQLQATFGWSHPFRDPGVGQFGLDNAVFAAADTFIEVLSPIRPDTAAGRHMQRRDGDSGYMAIFQVDDITAGRARIAAAGIRTVWKADLPDMAGTHLHPNDVPGAIVPSTGPTRPSPGDGRDRSGLRRRAPPAREGSRGWLSR